MIFLHCKHVGCHFPFGPLDGAWCAPLDCPVFSHHRAGGWRGYSCLHTGYMNREVLLPVPAVSITQTETSFSPVIRWCVCQHALRGGAIPHASTSRRQSESGLSCFPYSIWRRTTSSTPCEDWLPHQEFPLYNCAHTQLACLGLSMAALMSVCLSSTIILKGNILFKYRQF